MMKQIQFGESIFFEDGVKGWTSLDQTWWTEEELTQSVEEQLQEARSGHPDAEARGLEARLEAGGDERSARMRLHMRYVVLRSKKLLRMAAKSGTSDDVSVTLQEYACNQTRQNRMKAVHLGRKDEDAAKKIYDELDEPAARKSESAIVAPPESRCQTSADGAQAPFHRCISC